MEVTKWLKPLVQRVTYGDLARVQAVTRVNAEQALYGEGRVKPRFQTSCPDLLLLLRHPGLSQLA